jgi:hypothetical protein
MGFFNNFISRSNTNEEIKSPIGNYNYSKNVPKSHRSKRNTGAFKTAYTLQDNLVRSSSILISGTEKCPSKNIKNDMRLGERKFFISGICGPKSIDNCNGKPRHIIINNLPSGNFNRNTNYSPGSDQNGNHAGLIPSAIEDILELNPLGIVESLAGTNKTIHPKCHKIDFEEKKFIRSKKRKDGVITKTFVHKDICTPIPLKNIESLEKFTSLNIKSNFKKNFINFFILWIFLIVLLCFLFYTN